MGGDEDPGLPLLPPRSPVASSQNEVWIKLGGSLEASR